MATRRSGPCRGGSRVTTISIGCPGEPFGPRMSPCSFENRVGCDATSRMSACFVMAQNGSYPSGSNQATGAWARNCVHTSSG